MASLLLVDFSAKSRLGWLATLRAEHTIDVVHPGELPVRRVRSLRPDAVLLSICRGRLQETLRWCRIIKTDSAHPPKVGIFDMRARIRDIHQTMELSMIDGVLIGDAPVEDRRRFVDELLSVEGAVLQEHPVPGWRRWLSPSSG
jgi:hypothetical protein